MQGKHVLVDYHVHTPYCGHAQGKIIDYIESGIAAGLSEIGFADHLGRYYLSRSQKRRYWDWGMDEKACSRYFEELAGLRDVYNDRIAIKIGMEVDFIAGAEDIAGQLIEKFPCDFILGSIHCLPEFGWRHLAETSLNDTSVMYAAYFTQACECVKSGLFNSLAHLDFIWRYVKWPKRKSIDVYPMIHDAVSCAAKNDCCIEINANGYLWSQLYTIRQGDPFAYMIKSINEENVAVTIGSDAHSPSHVAKLFPQLIEYLGTEGIRQVEVLTKKKRKSVTLKTG
ncbi:MAG: histidinol-phosphatase HisJ family protein [Chitinivibrionales bacterium]|nr:histidinol-phosphatase HisJ family protein [Chitinivibrionales bacterium]